MKKLAPFLICLFLMSFTCFSQAKYDSTAVRIQNNHEKLNIEFMKTFNSLPNDHDSYTLGNKEGVEKLPFIPSDIPSDTVSSYFISGKKDFFGYSKVNYLISHSHFLKKDEYLLIIKNDSVIQYLRTFDIEERKEHRLRSYFFNEFILCIKTIEEGNFFEVDKNDKLIYPPKSVFVVYKISEGKGLHIIPEFQARDIINQHFYQLHPSISKTIEGTW